MGGLFASLLATKAGRAVMAFAGGAALVVLAYFGFVAWLAAHDASVAAEARRGYVLLAEKTTAEAKAAELQRQLTAANASLTSFRQRLEADAKADAAREKEREDEILGYELRLSQANRACFLDRSDVDFLRNH